MKLQKDPNGKLVLSNEQIDKTVQRILNKKKKHKTKTFTMLIDGKLIMVKSTGGANKMHFQSKQNVSLFLKELIENAVPSESRKDYVDMRIRWLYYDSYITIYGIICYWLVNIKEVDGVFNFYDLNKRKEVDMSATSNR